MVIYNNFHKIKVGIFDSGIGGLPVYENFKKRILLEGLSEQVSIHYLGDTKNFPYGTKAEKELNRIVFQNLSDLLTQGCNIIGIACNTASIVYNKANVSKINPFIYPIINLSANKAAEHSKRGVYVISSNFTASQHGYKNLINEIKPNLAVYEAGEQDLIQAIEQADGRSINKHVQKIIKQLPRSIDTLVLGCTHFSHVKKHLTDEANKQGKEIFLVDPTNEIVERLIQSVHNRLAITDVPAKSEILFSGASKYLDITN